MAHTDCGHGHSSATYTLAASMVTPSVEMMWPRYATVLSPKAHFDCLMKRECSCSLVKTMWRWRRCSNQDELYISMSSKKMRTNQRRKGHKTSFISSCNVDGAFVKRNGMTRNSKSPSCVWNAVFPTSSWCIRTW
jgi:hypothetical protein